MNLDASFIDLNVVNISFLFFVGFIGGLVATVFLFSFAHGAFASNLWSLMGIKPMKKETLQPSVGKTVTQTKKIQKRPRAYAYINPFHKI